MLQQSVVTIYHLLSEIPRNDPKLSANLKLFNIYIRILKLTFEVLRFKYLQLNKYSVFVIIRILVDTFKSCVDPH